MRTPERARARLPGQDGLVYLTLPVPLPSRRQRPHPPLAEVQVAEEERLLQLGQATLFIA